MKTPVKFLLIVLLFLLWLLPGLIGRDPWKADEPYSFGMTYHIMQTGDWVEPEVAGVPFLEKPPLYYLTAAISAKVFSPVLAPHDAARLVNILWLGLALTFLFLAVRELFGNDAAWSAPLLLLGCAILQIPGHKLITDIGQLAGYATGLYGLALARRKPASGGFWLGTGAGIGFLTKGLLIPGALALTALTLPAFFSRWRTKEYVRTLFIAFLASLPWVVIWPAALYHRSHDFFVEWFWRQNFGRFTGFEHAGSHNSHWYYLLNLPWLAWPVLPLAIWSAHRFRAEGAGHPFFELPLLSFLVMLGALSLSASTRDIYALPLLLPLTLMAAAGIRDLPARAAAFMQRGSIVLFGSLAALLWTVWTLRMAGGKALMHYLPERTVHYPAFDGVLLAIAILFTIAWLGYTVFTWSGNPSVAMSWTSGVILVWALVMTLFLPWLEANSSFRETFTGIRSVVPAGEGCVASYGIGESERAMLEYYGGIDAVPLEDGGRTSCGYMLVGSEPSRIAFAPPLAGSVIWTSSRPAHRPKEHYTLYRMNDSETAKGYASGQVILK